jgi:hypothetical protein
MNAGRVETPGGIITISRGVCSFLFYLALALSPDRLRGVQVFEVHRPAEVDWSTSFGFKKLQKETRSLLNGEAGYQAECHAGLRFSSGDISVEKRALGAVPAGVIGVVIAQVGKPLPIGRRARYTGRIQKVSDLNAFMKGNGQKGVQRPVLAPEPAADSSVGFLVITKGPCLRPALSPTWPTGFKNGRSPVSIWARPQTAQVVGIPMVEKDKLWTSSAS